MDRITYIESLSDAKPIGIIKDESASSSTRRYALNDSCSGIKNEESSMT